MKGNLLTVLAIILLTIVSGVVESYAAEARAYATITIIIPPIPQQQENVQVLTAQENNTQEQNTSGDMQLASAQAEQGVQKN